MEIRKTVTILVAGIGAVSQLAGGNAAAASGPGPVAAAAAQPDREASYGEEGPARVWFTPTTVDYYAAEELHQQASSRDRLAPTRTHV
ncbi:hypothetical protein HD597_000642 [Nonomuraea thailandensis]|uniref:Uncharacterized protein n=1 Tax=Nonomuraea thailandensis TaxID=1188745 RepID=A0A9X2G9N9_9ACTN|nr:hypothetical protein [Nonomuraea thailandensis]MCP2353622.1 hypothetical protein [Nonomuraea thailandensis]